MNVVDFNGHTYSWPPKGHEVRFDDIRPRSDLHIRCRKLLRSMYPTQSILEEVPLPGIGLFCDFYLPMRHLVIECNGEQHDKYTPFFHANTAGFTRHKARDENKIEWCKINNIRVVSLSFSESDEEWKTKIEDV
jgi:hypothetical protein